MISIAKEYAQRFYQSKEWKKCRKSFIAYRVSIDGGMCQRCKERLGYIVHHKEPITPENINNPEITLNHENLEYVCKPCHDDEHFEDMHGVEREQTRCVFGPDGQPIPREVKQNEQIIDN